VSSPDAPRSRSAWSTARPFREDFGYGFALVRWTESATATTQCSRGGALMPPSTGGVSGSPDVSQLPLMPRKYRDVETSAVMIRGRFGA
jgi:hypothetical protein